MEMNKEALLDMANKVKEYTMGKGADAAEVYFSYQKSMEVMAETQSIATERDKSELGFSVRVIKNGAEGFSYSNKLDFDSLSACADEAIGIAKVSPPKEALSLPMPTKYPTIEGIYSKAVSEISVEDMISNMKIILGKLKESKIPVKVGLSPLAVEESWIGIVNSHGVEGFERSNSYQAGFFTVAREGSNIGSFVVEDFFTRDPSSINYEEFTDRLIKKAVANVNPIIPKDIKSDTVVFKEGAVFPIAQVLGFAVSADNVQQNRSMWKDKLLSGVAIDSFSMSDDSHNPERGAMVKSFDDEGTVTKNTSIIKNGVLESFLFDELRAKRADTVSTGNGARMGTKFMNPINTIFPNGPIIHGGDMNDEELFEDIKEGIIFDRFSGSVQAPNGIFSGVVKGAQMIRNGELAEPCTNVTVGGNIFDVLFNITGMGKEVSLINGFLSAPLIKAKGVPIKTE
ncbi:MAG: TldD/PmbA family protein [Candidatus Heimdallarchaeota archaeon]|nr:TldD/PmbA family protein [Candidatus Heimdallarchaeota archaeon]